MTTCSDCSKCRFRDQIDADLINHLAIVGNINVGKTTLFSRITTGEPQLVSLTDSFGEISSAPARHADITIFDTPGTFSIFGKSDEERLSRDVLLHVAKTEHSSGIIFIADVKNLKRSLELAVQYAEYGLPMMLVINMMDEAASHGIFVDTQRLSEIFGLEVYQTAIREGIGVPELLDGISNMRIPNPLVELPPKIEHFLDMIGKILTPSVISPRLLGIMLLVGDLSVESYVNRKFGPIVFRRLKELIDEFHREDKSYLPIALGNIYQKKAQQIMSEVASVEPQSKSRFTQKLGNWCTQISTGVPIALVILYLMYMFVGSFGATYLVDMIEVSFFQGLIMPIANHLLQPIPSQFLRELLIDENFGVIPTGIFLALGLVGPVMFCFYLAFGLLEDSGYIQRLSVLLDRIFRMMGLNGKGVIPLIMGFSCVTMSLLSTRVLETEKEKNIASFILFLGAPCAPMLAVMFTILDRMPKIVTVMYFAFIFIQMFLAGVIANRYLPGERTPLLMELIPIRIPNISVLVRNSAKKTIFFLKEAVPMFALSSVVVFIFKWFGGLQMLEHSLQHIIDIFLGLPEDSVQIFLKAIIRRESGATELLNLSGHYTHLQLVVSLLVLTIMLPCTNSAMVLYKERGPGVTATLIAITTFWAITFGSLVNHFCLWLGITFT
ncbi:MAG: ferrous iron transporter B [Candidatus Riflebacteria bacterium]|nr:ferrous iron transporter B [Candidatus Riflebacteria bacterium]